MIKRFTILLLLIASVIFTAVIGYSPQPVHAQDPVPLITIIFPTPTRTPTPVNIGNFVWDDLDQDGRQDAGEPGLAGLTVQLWNSTKTSMIHQTVTSASGNYTLISPGPGSFRVRVVLPTIMDQFSPMDSALAGDTADSDINPSGADIGFTNVINIASNVISIVSIDAGVIRYRTPTPTRTPTPVSIGNFVWDDIDQDGQQDAGEPGLAGVTVQLWNSTKTSMIHQTVTTATGNYTLVSPGPGSFRVRVVLPAVMDQFSPKDSSLAGDTADSDINPSGSDLGFTDVINIASNVISISSIDAGVIRYRTPTPTRTPTPVNIGNFVWYDADEDGQQDAGEPGLVGVTVQLWNATKNSMIHQTVTSASGNYTLVSPGPGSFRVRVVLPGVMDQFSPMDSAAVPDTADSDINPSGADLGFTNVINIASNVISITSIDAGIILSAAPTPIPATATPVPVSYDHQIFLPLIIK